MKPNKIYKHVSISTLQKILENQAIKFSSPKEFNDPFDCDVNLLDFKMTENLSSTVKVEIEQLKSRLNRKSKRKLNWEILYKKAQIAKVNESKITCFTLENNIPLMWSHYSEKHFGACIEFDNKLNKRFLSISENHINEGIVGYESEIRINYLEEERISAIYKLFLNKSDCWSYEKEYRIFALNLNNDIQKFEKDFIKAIYFGIKTPTTDISKIKRTIKTHSYQNVKFFKASKNNLSIKFKEI